MKKLPFYICLLTAVLCLSCSENKDGEDEYANWTERNDLYFASLQDSLQANPAQWRRIKSIYLDQNSEGKATDYVYVKVIESAPATDNPQAADSVLHTDSVRIMYQGRTIPTASYPQGYVFDGTVYGDYASPTNATAKLRVASCVDGMATVLQHMTRGDHWRIYIPSELGYGEQNMGNSGIPPHSVLIFELTLVDFCRAGESLPVWSSRQRGR